MIRSQIPPIDPLRDLLFKNLKIEEFLQEHAEERGNERLRAFLSAFLMQKNDKCAQCSARRSLQLTHSVTSCSKILRSKNFYRSTQRREEMRGFAHSFPLSSCKRMISVANAPLADPSN
jgi:predicted transposase YdaD